jgi:hypothetical protein
MTERIAEGAGFDSPARTGNQFDSEAMTAALVESFRTSRREIGVSGFMVFLSSFVVNCHDWSFVGSDFMGSGFGTRTHAPSFKPAGEIKLKNQAVIQSSEQPGDAHFRF